MTKTNLRMAIFFIAVLTTIIGVRARTEGPGGSAAASQVPASGYDLVIANGRVMDPESGLDAVRNVGITAGKNSRGFRGTFKRNDCSRR
jgi:hypothetical protein